MQVYAIPSDTVYSVDPASNQSTILITRVENEFGQLIGYGYLLNATTTYGLLNYTVTPSNSNLLISSGANALNISTTIFYATPQNHSIFQASNIQLDSMQTANFTINNWQTLNNTNSNPVTLTISPTVPEFSPTLILPLFMIVTLLGVMIFKKKRNVKKQGHACKLRLSFLFPMKLRRQRSSSLYDSVSNKYNFQANKWFARDKGERLVGCSAC
jgi:hypothetical protein